MIVCIPAGKSHTLLGMQGATAFGNLTGHAGRQPMTDKVYKLIEMVGTSTKSSDDAVQNAIERAAQTLRHLDWFEVVESRGNIKDGKIASFQVTLKIGFRLE